MIQSKAFYVYQCVAEYTRSKSSEDTDLKISPTIMLPEQMLGVGEKSGNVGIVTRDRSKAYESGIRRWAPAAIQVAARFHLLQNLAETLDQACVT